MTKPYRATITIHLEAEDPADAPELLYQALGGMSTGSTHVSGTLLNGRETNYEVRVVENQESGRNEFQEMVDKALGDFYREVDSE